MKYIGYEQERVRFAWLDLQERGRIQRELAQMEQDLLAIGPADKLTTRLPLQEGETA